jgi:hypothetical protein
VESSVFASTGKYIHNLARCFAFLFVHDMIDEPRVLRTELSQGPGA